MVWLASLTIANRPSLGCRRVLGSFTFQGPLLRDIFYALMSGLSRDTGQEIRALRHGKWGQLRRGK